MKIVFKHRDEDISFNLIYKKRKTLSIQVKLNGEINVLSPFGVEKEFILDKVKSNASWIIKKQNEINSIQNKKVKRSIVNGEKFMYLGRNYSLEVVYNNDISNINVKLFKGKLVVNTYTSDEVIIKKALELWYREKALLKIKEKIDHYQPYFECEVGSIKVKEQKRRWASCTFKNDILFNWRCIMAPSDILDYIVVHEMCHMKHKNHSKDYWKSVYSILPDYELRHKWLKENGIKLDL